MSKHSMRIGSCCHPELGLEPVERLDALGAPVLGAQPVLVERQRGVALGQLVDPALVAALGVPHLDRRVAALGQRLAEQRRPLARQARGHDHLRRDRR